METGEMNAVTILIENVMIFETVHLDTIHSKFYGLKLSLLSLSPICHGYLKSQTKKKTLYNYNLKQFFIFSVVAVHLIVAVDAVISDMKGYQICPCRYHQPIITIIRHSLCHQVDMTTVNIIYHPGTLCLIL